NGAPGALQHEVFVPEGSPLFLHAPSPLQIDVTLPAPFTATGRHFVAVQLVTQHVGAWYQASDNTGSAARTVLGSAHRRDRTAGDWEVHRTLFGDEIDLAFEVWGNDGTPPDDPTDPCGPWQQIPGPPLPPDWRQAMLHDLVVVDFDDVWAVGNRSVEILARTFETKTLALHWDGQAWDRIPTPDPSVHEPPRGTTRLEAVDALAGDFVWAVGNHEAFDRLGFVIDQPLVLRWDGATWSQVPVPNTDFDTSTLGVALIDRDTAWVVGGALQAPCGGALAL